MRTSYIVIPLIVLVMACGNAIDYPEGGYAYVKGYKAEDSTFYYLPVRDSFSRSDSFSITWDSDILHKYFDEPNYSLQPAPEDLFRLHWGSSLGGDAFITLSRSSIIVKKSIPSTGYYYQTDKNKLSPQEQKDLSFFEYHFTREYESHSPLRIRRLDSLLRERPELKDSRYYHALLKKSIVFPHTPGTKYYYREIPVTASEYRMLVSAFNNSGFWQMPVNAECEQSIFDGEGIIVEANTKTKYKVVIFSSCHSSVMKSAFARACQQLIDMAGLGHEISVYRENADSASLVEEPDSLVIQDIQLEESMADQSKTQNRKRKLPNE